MKKEKKREREWSKILKTLTKKERLPRRQKGLRWRSRGERKKGDSYTRQKASETRERAGKVIEKRQTWHTEGKQSLDKDQAQSEGEFVSVAAVTQQKY